MADEAARLPRVEDGRYLGSLRELVRRSQIGLLVPTIDTELQDLAGHRETIARWGCLVAISSPELVRAVSDKWLMRDLFRGVDVALPKAWLPGTLETPTPCHHMSSSSPARQRQPGRPSPRARACPGGCRRAFRRDHRGGDRRRGGLVDALLDLKGNILSYVPRRRIKTIGGESVEGVTIAHTPFASWMERALGRCGERGARGPLTVQLFLTPSGPVLTEINPRFGGGFPLAAAAGADYAESLFRIRSGEPVPASIGAYRVGLYMTRSYEERFLVSPPWST